MDELTDILIKATAGISPEYFLLPIHGAEPVYRERVYCYELYHQMRSHWPNESPYRLNGEVDKAAHPYFTDGTAPKPDLLVHQPGTGRNCAAVEIKTARAMAAGIMKDLQTLTRFVNEFGYQRAIYLLYGDVTESTMQMVDALATEMPGGERLEIWFHPAAETPAIRVR